MSDESTLPQTSPETVADAVKALEAERVKSRAEVAEVVGSHPNEPQAEAAEGEDTPAAEPAEEPADAVEVPEGKDLKGRIKENLARARAERVKAEAEAKAIRESAEAEAKRIREEAAAERAQFDELKQLLREKPDAFLEKAGWDLNKLVETKLADGTTDGRVLQLQRQLESMAQRLEEREKRDREAAEARQRQEAEHQQRAQIEAAEKAFLDSITPDKFPHLAKFKKASELATKAQAYAIAAQFHQDHGRHATSEEIAVNLEKILSGVMEAGDETTEVKRSGGRLTPKSAAKTNGVRTIDDMSDEERVALAAETLKKERLAQKNPLD